MIPPDRSVTIPLTIIATILVVAALHLTQSITLPLALALFVITLVWPIQVRLERWLPRPAAYVVTLLLVVALFTLVAGALVLAAAAAIERLSDYAGRVEALYSSAIAWLEEIGLGDLLGDPANASQQSGAILSAAGSVLAGTYALVGLLTLTLIFLILGLLEVTDFRRKLERGIEARFGAAVLASLGMIAQRYQRYVLIRTFVSALTGLLTWLFGFMVGLDLAFLWGLIAFLLNYIPVLGSIVAVIPPSLFALLQFDGWGMPLLVLGGMTLIQFTIGNYLDPRLEGRTLRMSPLVVMFSIVFWGFVWGAPGALLGVPLTVGILIACEQFERSRWISTLLSSNDHFGR